MKQLRTHQFAVANAPWLTLWHHEWEALRGLPAWSKWLFMELLARADFKTGRGTTGIGELVNALTPDQPERGPRLEAPSSDQVQKMLRRFEALGIFARNVKASVIRGKVFFEVAPRTREIAAAEKQAGKLAGLQKEKTVGESKGYAQQGAKTRGETRGVSQGKILNTARDELSTGAAPPPQKIDPPKGVERRPSAAPPLLPPTAAPIEVGALARERTAPGGGGRPPGMPIAVWEMKQRIQASAAGNTGLEEGGARSAVAIGQLLPPAKAENKAAEPLSAGA